MKKDKPWRRLPKTVEIIRENFDGFFRFVYERHSIWHKRFVLKEPPPWTKDPYLRDYKFTNVYRELDRGTLWLMRHILPGFTGRDLVWMVTLYRLLNRVETFEAIGLPLLSGYDQRDLRRKLQDWRDLGNKVFTSAHLTLPTHEKGKSKIEKYMEVLSDLREMLESRKLGCFFDTLSQAKSLEEAWKILQRIPCVGGFIAYEIACDLMYANFLPFNENDWANAGPGCRFGIRLIFPRRYRDKEWLEAMKELREGQDREFKRLGLKMPYFNRKRLSLRNIEHSLCEFGKWWKLTHHCGKSRQLFKPSGSECGLLPSGQLPLFIK